MLNWSFIALLFLNTDTLRDILIFCSRFINHCIKVLDCFQCCNHKWTDIIPIETTITTTQGWYSYRADILLPDDSDEIL